MPKPLPNESKKEYIGRCVKQLISEEGKPQKRALAICFSMWDRENLNESLLDHMDNWIQMKTDYSLPIQDFITAIGRVHFRQFSNSEDMLNFSKIYYDDFVNTFQLDSDWDEFSEELEDYWIKNIFGK